MMIEKGRVALVTGAARGIGKAIAVAFAKNGVDIMIGDRQPGDEGIATVKEIQGLGRKAEIFELDVRDHEKIKEMVTKTVQAFGKLDILVHAAGVGINARPIIETEDYEFRRAVEINVYGGFYLVHDALPYMRQNKRGDIIFISAEATRKRRPNSAPYTIGKVALETLALVLAMEERRHGIRVNCIAPGIVETDLGRKLAKALWGVDDPKDAYPKLPFGRMSQPYDIANVATFLISKEAEYITHQVIYTDAGGTLPPDNEL